MRERGHAASRPVGRRRRSSAVLRAHVEWDDERRYASLEELAEAADVVVCGQVVDVRPGRVVDEGPGASSAFEEVAVHAHRAFPEDVEGSIVVLEQLAALDGFGVASLNGVRRAALGDRGVWFLSRGEAGDVLQPINASQSQFLLDERSRVRGPVENRMVWPVRNELTSRLAGQPVEALQEVVADVWAARPRDRGA